MRSSGLEYSSEGSKVDIGDCYFSVELQTHIYEPHHEKTNILVSDQV